MKKVVQPAEYPVLLDAIKKIAYGAGRHIMEIYDLGYEITEKSDATPLTEADMAAHHAIMEGLLELTPGIPVLSEESRPTSFIERSSWSQYWLVDPLDGTREFIKRNGEFTVNIALIDEGDPVIGVVYAPVISSLYYAARGLGASKRLELNDPVAIHVRSHCPHKVVVAGSRSHQTPKFKQFLSRLPDYEVISMGSALKSCLVAEGVADIYARLGPTSEWDTAAAQCIVEEAGGRITDTRMNPLRYNTKDELLNPHFFVFGDHSVDWSKYLS
ncbi:MAG: 3'(2'),5'-bisphosphate nucleotidase CysQ [Proteobacteria bacterium]|nr:3'(2'),5'-bisphosphate nucleotidase CysQ [Pseudomonadota bacterium]